MLVASTSDFSPANHLIEAFNKTGYEVFVISDVKGPKANFVAQGGINLKQILSEFKIIPSFIVFVEGGEMGIFPTFFSDIPCPKFWWGIDTHNDYQKHLRISRLFDHSFIAQKSFVNLLRADGIGSVSWLPLAYPISQSDVFSRTIDVSYVGSTNWNLYPERGELLQSIENEFANNYIGTTTSIEMLRVYENSLIVFNYSLKNDINMRFFEAMGSGALLVTNEIHENGLEDLFVSGEDLVIYRDKDELVAKIRNLLDRPSQLDLIARNGMDKVRSSHTYYNRALEMIRLAGEDFSKQPEDRFAISGALLSMGFISDSTTLFFSAANYEAKGLGNRLILTVIRPAVRLLVVSMKTLRKIFQVIRRFL